MHQEIQERKSQGAPPLQISFVCDAQENSSSVHETTVPSFVNPFIDHNNDSNDETQKKRNASLKRHEAFTQQITALEESDDDENAVVFTKPRIDVSHLSGEKCIEILGAHTNRNEWPSSTKIACWNCTFQFDGIPIAIPGSFHKKKNILIGCYGVFCSFNCAKRYCMNKNRHDSMQQLQLLSYLHKKILGNVARIFPASPFQVLDKYGGYMCITEYRKNFITLPPNNNMFNPEIRQDYVRMLNEKQIPYFHTILHSHNQKLMTDSIQEKKTRNKVYERTTPLPGSQNLQLSMNIKPSIETVDFG